VSIGRVPRWAPAAGNAGSKPIAWACRPRNEPEGDSRGDHRRPATEGGVLRAGRRDNVPARFGGPEREPAARVRSGDLEGGSGDVRSGSAQRGNQGAGQWPPLPSVERFYRFDRSRTRDEHGSVPAPITFAMPNVAGRDAMHADRPTTGADVRVFHREFHSGTPPLSERSEGVRDVSGPETPPTLPWGRDAPSGAQEPGQLVSELPEGSLDRVRTWTLSTEPASPDLQGDA
jgi:hypothetical protein